MSELTDIRKAIATAIADVPGLQAHFRVPPQVHPPAAIVEPERIPYHETMDPDFAAMTFKVTVLVAMNATEVAQDEIDTYISPAGTGSIRAAIEADPSLGGVVDDVIVREARDIQPYEVGAETYFGARLIVEVRA